MDETINVESSIGKRLEKMKKDEAKYLLFNEKSIPLTAKISIGRSETNDVVIDDTMASREHAIIQKIKEDYFIKDLNSTNGTYVNNQKVPKDKYIKINSNDIIKIGRSELTFC